MSSKINLQPCEYARKSSIFQDNQLIYNKSMKDWEHSPHNKREHYAMIIKGLPTAEAHSVIGSFIDYAAALNGYFW